ncbi:hypothetical protein F5877DRAFT_68003 [Lentinula edodes]|nr:hypothetical protein F5877DRAFT_68003 [Lentinula edodes]
MCLPCALYYWHKAISNGLQESTKKFEDVYGISDLSFTAEELAWERKFDPEDIRRRVIDAKKKIYWALRSNTNLPLLNCIVMPPPPPPSLSGSRKMPANHIGGPAAHLSTGIGSTTGRAIGYGEHHRHYHQAIKNQQAKAYVHSNELISVAYLIGYCVNPKASTKSYMPKFVPISNIAETDPSTPRGITVEELIVQAKRLVWPQLLAKFPDFSWDWTQVEVREIWPTAWVNLIQAEPGRLWFYDRDQLLKAPRGGKGKTGDKVFTHNAKPFEIGIVIPYEDFENALELAEDAVSSQTTTKSKNPSRSTAVAVPMNIRSTAATHSMNTCSTVATHSMNTHGPASSLFTHGWQDSLNTGTNKGSRKRSLSVTSPNETVPFSRASKKTYRSPKRGAAKHVLQSGGQVTLTQVKQFDGTYYSVELFQIPSFDYADVAASPTPVRFTFDIETRDVGSIVLNPTVIGKGSFRTAHSARLQTPKWNCNVIVKRPYTTGKSKGTSKDDAHLLRLPVGAELESIVRDANLHLWSDMLFEFALGWITRFLGVTKLIPPANIPSFRYVNAFVLTVHSEVTGSSVKNLSSRKMTLMAEEVIPAAETSFCKYINNGSADIGPLIEELALNDPHRIETEYLSSIQHIIFWKTEGFAYLSDFQGCSGLLTDGQIMTAPELKDDLDDLFGPGNVRNAFNKFLTEHKCSKSRFCRFFDLPLINMCSAQAVEEHGVPGCEALQLYDEQAMVLETQPE